jgi:hypothetical protein
MSIKHLALAADITGLPSTCKLVLYALAMSADIWGAFNVTNTKLQELTGLSERAIRTAMRKLEALGHLDRAATFHTGYAASLVLA